MQLERWTLLGVAALFPNVGLPSGPLFPDPAEIEAIGDTVRTTIGVVDGDERQVFGRIRRVEVDPDGDIFILDDQALVISWFGSDGTFKGRAGRAGDGPGEFRAPVAMTLDPEGRLHVLDEAHSRVTVFERTADGLTYRRDVRLPVRGGDICIQEDRYYVLAPLPQGLIHVFTLEGERALSFGELVADVPPEMRDHADILRHMQNRGHLLCLPSSRQVVVVPEEAARIRAFDIDGTPLWETHLSSFFQRRYELSRGGRAIRIAPDPQSNAAHTASAVARDGETIVVTLTESTLEDPVGTREWRTLALVDGRETARSPASALLAASGPTRKVLFVNHPFPRVLVEHYRR